MFTPQQGHVDSALTNVSVMYRNQAFIAEDVFPPLPVDKQSDKYFVYGLDNLRVDSDTRRPAALSNEMTWSLSTNTYFADGHAMHSWIPDESRPNTDTAIDLDTDTTVQLTDKIFLNREAALVAALTAAMNPIDLSAGAYANAWDTPTVDPVAVIDLAKESVLKATGQMANMLVLPRPVFRGVRNNPLVKARVSGALNGIGGSLITAAQLAEVFEVDKVLVPSAVQVTSKEGQAIASSFVWGKNALLYYKPPAPGPRTVALGYQFTWQAGRLGSLVYRGRDDNRHADRIEVMRYYDERIVSAAAGVMWSNATQN